MTCSLPFNIVQEMGEPPLPGAHGIWAGKEGWDKPLTAEKGAVFFMIFGRTNLRIGVSGAKFDAEVDFEVHVTPAP